MNLSLNQEPSVIADCRELCDAWQDYRFHRREAWKAQQRVVSICNRYGVPWRRPRHFGTMVLLVGTLLLVGCKTPVRVASTYNSSVQIEAVARAPQLASVTVAWNASPDSSVTGYRVYYYKSPDAGTNVVEVPGDVLTAQLAGLQTRTTYKIYCKAFNTEGESPSSNVVIYRVPRK